MFNGIKTGIQMCADALTLAVLTVPTNPAAIGDFKALARQWVEDAKRFSLFNWDPFKPSRELWKVIKVKYGG